MVEFANERGNYCDEPVPNSEATDRYTLRRESDCDNMLSPSAACRLLGGRSRRRERRQSLIAARKGRLPPNWGVQGRGRQRPQYLRLQPETGVSRFPPVQTADPEGPQRVESRRRNRDTAGQPAALTTPRAAPISPATLFSGAKTGVLPCFALFVVAVAASSLDASRERSAKTTLRHDTGKVENARRPEVRLGDEEGVRFVQRPSPEGLSPEGRRDQCARASVRGAERRAVEGQDRRIPRRAGRRQGARRPSRARLRRRSRSGQTHAQAAPFRRPADRRPGAPRRRDRRDADRRRQDAGRHLAPSI